MNASTGLVILMISLIVLAAFNTWLRQQKRQMAHRERMLALEKGVELPALEQETLRSNWNVQRLLLLAGLCWIALGFGTMAVLNQMIVHAPPLPPPNSGAEYHLIPAESFIPSGLQYIGLVGIFLGIAHLVVFFVDRTKGKS